MCVLAAGQAQGEMCKLAEKLDSSRGFALEKTSVRLHTQISHRWCFMKWRNTFPFWIRMCCGKLLFCGLIISFSNVCFTIFPMCMVFRIYCWCCLSLDCCSSMDVLPGLLKIFMCSLLKKAMLQSQKSNSFYNTKRVICSWHGLIAIIFLLKEVFYQHFPPISPIFPFITLIQRNDYKIDLTRTGWEQVQTELFNI